MGRALAARGGIRPIMHVSLDRSLSMAAIAFLFVAATAPTALAQVMPGGSSGKSKSSEVKQKAPKKSKKSAESRQAAPGASASRTIPVTPFGESNGGEPINASGAVALGDGRFLLCDNRTPDVLFELRLDAQGRKEGALVRRSIAAAGGVADMEGMARVDLDGERFFVATSSFGLRPGGGKKDGGRGSVEGGLLRVDVGADGSLTARRMTGVREWLVAHYPELRATATLDPDRNGLNLEGLAWDPARRALLFGVRTPLVGGRPLVLPVRIAGPASEWTVGSLEALPAITLALDASAGLGIRSIEYDTGRNLFWVAVGRAVSGGRAPFAMYRWDGNAEGTVRKLDALVFGESMKVEGVVAGTIGGKDAVLLLDDGGGYSVVWGDDPRLQ